MRFQRSGPEVIKLISCSAELSLKGLGARTVEIGLVSEMHIFFICVKGVNLMEKNACFIEIALKLLELRCYKETYPYPFL